MKTESVKSKFILCAILFIVLTIVLYGFFIEPYRIDTHHIMIKDKSLGKVLNGLVAVHLSDIHIKYIGRREKEILKIINELKPDLIFLTGDYVEWRSDYAPALTFLSQLHAPHGVFAVMGDYDYSVNSRKSCLFCHEPLSGSPTRKHTVRFLKNGIERIDLPKGPLWIGGIDFEENGSLSEEQMRFFFGRQPIILLSHTPLAFDRIDNNSEVFMLAGDTHGGQMPLPAFLWKFLGYEKCARYLHGFYNEGNKKLYVSRGIGTSHVPFRFFCRPELVVFHFTS